jgi:hypothetical protein
MAAQVTSTYSYSTMNQQPPNSPLANALPPPPSFEDDPIAQTASKIALGFENINVTRESNPKKVILNNVSGYVKCGGITAGS